MQWLVPAISMDCGFKFAVTLILFVRYFETREKVSFWWATGWLFFGLHNVMELIIIGTGYEPLWFLHHVFFAFTAAAFLESMGQMQKRPVSRIWHAAAAAVSAGVVITSYVGVFVVKEWYAAAVPAAFLNGLAFIACAFSFLKITKRNKSAARLPVFLGFLLNGLHNLDYPFLRPVVWFAPIGFSLGILFSLILVVGLLLMLTESLRRQKGRSRRVIQNLSVLNAVSSLISRTLDLEKILADVLNEMLKSMSIEAGYISLLDEGTEKLKLKASCGLSEEYERGIDGVSLDEDTICSRVAHDGEPVAIDNISGYPHLKTEIMDKEGLRSFVCVPLKAKKKVKGVMGITSHRLHPFTPQDIQLLVVIANEVGTAIENAELYEKVRNWNIELENTMFERTRDLADARKATLNMLEDITEAYSQLKDTQAQLVQSEKMAAIGQMAAMVGHEIRNPLNGIRMSLYYLKMKLGGASSEVRAPLGAMEKEVARVSDIINDILEFSRPASLTLSPTDINAVVEDTLSDAEKVNRVKNIEVVKKLSPGIPKVPLDGVRFRRAINNLVLNAFQAMSEGGRLTASTEVSGKVLKVSITDTGEGIAEEDLTRIFDSFYSSKARGIGLGLTVVNEILKAHNSTIEVKTGIGKGSTFSISIPLEKEH